MSHTFASLRCCSILSFSFLSSSFLWASSAYHAVEAIFGGQNWLMRTRNHWLNRKIPNASTDANYVVSRRGITVTPDIKIWSKFCKTNDPNSNNNICWKARTIFTAYTVSHMFASLCSCSIFSILLLSFFSAPSAYDTVEIYGEQDWLMRTHHWLKRRIPSVSTESRDMQKQTLLKRPSAVPLFISKSKALLNLNFLIGTGNTASELLKSRSMLITHIGLQPNQHRF